MNYNYFQTDEYQMKVREDGIEQLRQIFRWIKTNNRLPSSRNTLDLIERKYATRIRVLRSARYGNRNHKWFEIYQVIAEDYGYHTLFDKQDLQGIGNQIVTDLCEYIKKHNKIPNSVSNDSYERRLYKKLVELKIAKNKGHAKCTFYDSYQTIADSYELSNIFDYVREDKRSSEITYTHMVCKWIKENKRNPHYLHDAYIYGKLSPLRKSTNPDVNKIAMEYGLQDVFQVKTKRITPTSHHKRNEAIKSICEFYIENNRIPHRFIKNEIYLYNRYTTIKGYYNNGTLREESIKIMESYGMTFIFDASYISPPMIPNHKQCSNTQ